MAKFVGWRAIMSRDASNTPTSHRFGGSISIYQPQSTGQFKSIIVGFPYSYCTAGAENALDSCNYVFCFQWRYVSRTCRRLEEPPNDVVTVALPDRGQKFVH